MDYWFLLFFLSALVFAVESKLVVNETTTTFTMENERLSIIMAKRNGVITSVSLDGQSLLGSGQGLYLDCYCIPTGFYTVGSTKPTFTLLSGVDSTGTQYGGIILNDTYTPTGQFFQQMWFLREGETGLHTFTHLAYHNETTPFLRNLQELRTLFRPSSPLWTHLSTNEKQWAPLPSADAVAKQVVVQDATWWLGNTPDDAYVQQEAPYFTKYTFADQYRDHKSHGLYADGSRSNGTTYGAWLVMNTKDTYFGGPIHSDLTVDGIAYNYIVSNHHGAGTPNITNGFQRTFGPFYYHFNSGNGASMATLRAEADALADASWNAAFYDSIAQYVQNYVPSSSRGTFSARIKIPRGANRPIAVLSQNGVYFQDNVQDVSALQYWADIDDNGHVSIPRVKGGIYRLTVYASGIFGQYIQDNVIVRAGKNPTLLVNWIPESSGRELWRLGNPDKTAGEFLHGASPDPTHPLHPDEYLIYWGHYDFPTDFPNGVNFTIGESDVSKDWNYIHWSVFGPTYMNKVAHIENTSNWTINFDHKEKPRPNSIATLTIQLAGAKTASGNTDVPNGNYSNVTLNVFVNGHEPLPFPILWYQSSSCGVRSSVSCYNIAEKLRFPGNWLKKGHNDIVLSLPYNATGVETAFLPGSVYVQYDAIRLELRE